MTFANLTFGLLGSVIVGLCFRGLTGAKDHFIELRL